MKAVALDPDPCLISEDAGSRFRYQSLHQDYRLLMKKMDSTRKHLEKMKQKKLILLAEVHFLRRRYAHLLKNQVPSLPLVQETAQSQKWEAPKRCITEKGKKNGGKQAASQPPVPGYGISKKERIYNGKQAAWRPPVPSFEVNQKGGSYSGKDVAELQQPVCTGKEATLLRNASPILDLNQNDDRVYSGKEATPPNRFRAFDLNQISREEEELQADPELAIMESPANLMRGSDEQYADMKLSVCRNVGTNSSGAGKRKISWEDPVVLRV